MRLSTARTVFGIGVLVISGGALAYRWHSARAEQPRVEERCAERLRQRHVERSALVRIEKLIENRIANGPSSSADADWENAANEAGTYRDGLATVLHALRKADGARASAQNLIRAAGEPYNRRANGTTPDISAELDRLSKTVAEQHARAREELGRLMVASSEARIEGCSRLPTAFATVPIVKAEVAPTPTDSTMPSSAPSSPSVETCTPGTARCVGTYRQSCGTDRLWGPKIDCNKSNPCRNGQCVPWAPHVVPPPSAAPHAAASSLRDLAGF